MLYLVQIGIDDHSDWGVAHSRDVVLPDRIRHIRSMFVSAQLGQRSFIIPTTFPSVTDSGDFLSSPFRAVSTDPLIGSLSVSLNNSDVLMSSMPVYAQAKMQSSYRKNHIVFDKPIDVRSGSSVRLVMEERVVSPFYNKKLLLYRDNVRKALMRYQGLPEDLEIGNSYVVKLYIEYD